MSKVRIRWIFAKFSSNDAVNIENTRFSLGFVSYFPVFRSFWPNFGGEFPKIGKISMFMSFWRTNIGKLPDSIEKLSIFPGFFGSYPSMMQYSNLEPLICLYLLRDLLLLMFFRRTEYNHLITIDHLHESKNKFDF